MLRGGRLKTRFSDDLVFPLPFGHIAHGIFQPALQVGVGFALFPAFRSPTVDKLHLSAKAVLEAGHVVAIIPLGKRDQAAFRVKGRGLPHDGGRMAFFHYPPRLKLNQPERDEFVEGGRIIETAVADFEFVGVEALIETEAV